MAKFLKQIPDRVMCTTGIAFGLSGMQEPLAYPFVCSVIAIKALYQRLAVSEPSWVKPKLAYCEQLDGTRLSQRLAGCWTARLPTRPVRERTCTKAALTLFPWFAISFRSRSIIRW